MNYFSEIPWSNIASALTTLTLITALIGPKFKFVRRFIGASLQDMLGVTDIRADQLAMHNSNQARFEAMETRQESMQKELMTWVAIVDKSSHNSGGLT